MILLLLSFEIIHSGPKQASKNPKLEPYSNSSRGMSPPEALGISRAVEHVVFLSLSGSVISRGEPLSELT
jgi:hypothetical protein